MKATPRDATRPLERRGTTRRDVRSPVPSPHAADDPHARTSRAADDPHARTSRALNTDDALESRALGHSRAPTRAPTREIGRRLEDSTKDSTKDSRLVCFPYDETTNPARGRDDDPTLALTTGNDGRHRRRRRRETTTRIRIRSRLRPIRSVRPVTERLFRVKINQPTDPWRNRIARIASTKTRECATLTLPGHAGARERARFRRPSVRRSRRATGRGAGRSFVRWRVDGQNETEEGASAVELSLGLHAFSCEIFSSPFRLSPHLTRLSVCLSDLSDLRLILAIDSIGRGAKVDRKEGRARSRPDDPSRV